MEKTNIRLNNFFILINKGLNKYYLTDIDQINDWKELDNKNLKTYKKKDITEKINKLFHEVGINSNVNFIEMNKSDHKKDINISKLRQTFLNYLPIGLLVGFIILLELIYVVSQSKLNFTETISTNNNNISNQMLDNTKAIGNILYTDYFLLFQISGIILLVAMIGAIFLTIRKREGAKKQNIYKQTLKK